MLNYLMKMPYANACKCKANKAMSRSEMEVIQAAPKVLVVALEHFVQLQIALKIVIMQRTVPLHIQPRIYRWAHQFILRHIYCLTCIRTEYIHRITYHCYIIRQLRWIPIWILICSMLSLLRRLLQIHFCTVIIRARQYHRFTSKQIPIRLEQCRLQVRIIASHRIIWLHQG